MADTTGAGGEVWGGSYPRQQVSCAGSDGSVGRTTPIKFDLPDISKVREWEFVLVQEGAVIIEVEG